jgi:hypothetical protein
VVQVQQVQLMQVQLQEQVVQVVDQHILMLLKAVQVVVVMVDIQVQMV